ncbi:MAG: diphthine--ammonia ligase [Methanosarcinaceae archaeon]|nr:diphthine--ammonia ligase [Methanosarcinaceae archaeon]
MQTNSNKTNPNKTNSNKTNKKKITALISGGKDSVFAAYKLIQKGYSICSFVCLAPENKESYMFHSINMNLVKDISKACDIPLCFYPTKGIKEEELNELKAAIEIQKEKYKIDGVSSGAVESVYQKSRIDNICKELEIESLTPLWQKDPETLLKEMVECGMDIRIAAVAADGLDESYLGEKIDPEMIEKLKYLNKKKYVHIAGEGGEYETAVLDAPFFKKRIVPISFKKEWNGNRGFFYIEETKLENK